MVSPRSIPLLLIVFRFLAGPVILILSIWIGRPAGLTCVGLLAAGVLSDIFDGVVARRLGIVTPGLRKLDSKADVVFWACVAAAVMVMHPVLTRSLLPMIGVLVALEFVAPIVSMIRFRQEASTHHLLSKIFGLGLWALMSVLFLRGEALWLQWPVFFLGILSQCEAIAIMLVVPAWQADISSLRHALRLRAAAG